MSFHAQLIDLLKTDPRFVDDDGELIPAAVMDAAWKTDHALVKLLLSDKDIETKFFSEIDGHWVFETNTFIEYISDKNFLDNSYTRFRNRIGLTIGGKFLRERGEVALVWPYKDCYLEGGQTKEEERRREIFFNEVLAQDEITRLLDPKVLTHFTRYTARPVIASREAAKQSPRKSKTASGLDTAEERRLLDPRSDIQVVEEKVTGFRRDENGVIRENLIIKGNNLIALHTLKTQFRGRVKLIYIDPPYNAETDSFGYNDSFNHSTWLTFMKNRLEVARELLTADGVMFIQIDNRELAYLKILCDEVFGRDNFRNGIIVRKGQKNLQKQFSTIRQLNAGYDTILFYSKRNDIRIPNLIKVLPGKKSSSWNNHWRGTDRKTMRYELFGIIPETGQWRWEKDRTYRAVANYQLLLDYIKKMGIAEEEIDDQVIDEYFWRYIQENDINDLSEFEMVRLSKTGKPEHYIPASTEILLSENWLDINVAGRQSEFEHEKNEEILYRILDWLTSPGDIVLDFFLGSGTTAAVAHKMGRQYIGIEQMDYIETIPVERLKKVIAGEQGGVSKAVNWLGGGDFIYCELMKYNEAYMERIQAAQSSAELLQIWREMAEGSFLNWYVNPSMPEEAVKDFEAIGDLEKQKHLLAKLLDENQLYVNLSEMDDARFSVSEEDKALNRKFYGEGE